MKYLVMVLGAQADYDGMGGKSSSHSPAWNEKDLQEDAQPIALLADEDVLPEHALCPTPWNPFGLTVCSGTGRAAAQARPADESLEAQEQEMGLLLTLPQGLDWRMQPFSHVGGPGSRPRRVPPMRSRAA